MDPAPWWVPGTHSLPTASTLLALPGANPRLDSAPDQDKQGRRDSPLPCLAPQPWPKPPCQGTRWPAGHPRSQALPRELRSTGKALSPRVEVLGEGVRAGRASLGLRGGCPWGTSEQGTRLCVFHGLICFGMRRAELAARYAVGRQGTALSPHQDAAWPAQNWAFCPQGWEVTPGGEGVALGCLG